MAARTVWSVGLDRSEKKVMTPDEDHREED